MSISHGELIKDGFERVREVVEPVLEGLEEDHLMFRPFHNGNSIAWLVWHLTRIQDSHIAELAGEEQVWVEGGWYKKFNLPFEVSETGFGHNSEEVGAVKASADLLHRYFRATHEKTVKYLKNMQDDDFERIIDTDWDPPVTRAVRLISVLADDLQHAGQAAYVRGLL